MQAALKARIARKDWRNAAIVANNLSRLHLTIGDLPQALEYAQRSVDLAEQSGDAFWRMGRTTLANALHQAGRLDEAESLFREAEAMQKERQPEFPLLYSLQGFRYCDLLLSLGKHWDVRDRISKTQEWKSKQHWLLDNALSHLALGRAYLLETQQEGTGDLSEASEHLDKAVDGLRRSGQQDYIPRGLLARAALHRVAGARPKAERDLDEAMTIAKRSDMGLHQADAHLEYARLHLATGDKPKARDSLSTAKDMIERFGYHRRDGELAELEGQLSE